MELSVLIVRRAVSVFSSPNLFLTGRTVLLYLVRAASGIKGYYTIWQQLNALLTSPFAFC